VAKINNFKQNQIFEFGSYIYISKLTEKGVATPLFGEMSCYIIKNNIKQGRTL